ncbi:MAG TPA: hypothetical protein VKX49_27960 [Bryobacteraceae bacterium]|nr:hypothetical protein [Bryobacteraceae bacterium]
MILRSKSRPAVWLCIPTLIAIAVCADTSGARLGGIAGTALVGAGERSQLHSARVSRRVLSAHQLKRLRALSTETGSASFAVPHAPELRDIGAVAISAELYPAICLEYRPPSRAPPAA